MAIGKPHILKLGNPVPFQAPLRLAIRTPCKNNGNNQRLFWGAPKSLQVVTAAMKLKESWAPKKWCFWTEVLEKTLESPLDCKEIQPVHPKRNQSWIVSHCKDWCWSSDTLATWCKELIHWKRPWCWERLKAGGDREDRGWDGWIATATQWTWI